MEGADEGAPSLGEPGRGAGRSRRRQLRRFSGGAGRETKRGETHRGRQEAHRQAAGNHETERVSQARPAVAAEQDRRGARQRSERARGPQGEIEQDAAGDQPARRQEHRAGDREQGAVGQQEGGGLRAHRTAAGRVEGGHEDRPVPQGQSGADQRGRALREQGGVVPQEKPRYEERRYSCSLQDGFRSRSDEARPRQGRLFPVRGPKRQGPRRRPSRYRLSDLQSEAPGRNGAFVEAARPHRHQHVAPGLVQSGKNGFGRTAQTARRRYREGQGGGKAGPPAGHPRHRRREGQGVVRRRQTSRSRGEPERSGRSVRRRNAPVGEGL